MHPMCYNSSRAIYDLALQRTQIDFVFHRKFVSFVSFLRSGNFCAPKRATVRVEIIIAWKHQWKAKDEGLSSKSCVFVYNRNHRWKTECLFVHVRRPLSTVYHWGQSVTQKVVRKTPLKSRLNCRFLTVKSQKYARIAKNCEGFTIRRRCVYRFVNILRTNKVKKTDKRK